MGKLTAVTTMCFLHPKKPTKKRRKASDTKGVSTVSEFQRLDKLETGKPSPLQRNSFTKKESKSVNTSARENLKNNQKSKAVDQSEAKLPEQTFQQRVMTELLADNLPANKQRYASLKIMEYTERFPESHSVADCWAYVVQAVRHQQGLTGV